ncbi:MAG: iron-sulfur cluster assembly accessory protein [Gemmatimonadetes bacterium]|nr:iron-sulfur cluster assembly accessory protein [Gemmatimonadota bacterium]
MSHSTKAPVEFTAVARDTVRRFMQASEDANFAVRIRVGSPSPLDPRYEITLIERDEKSDEDVVFDEDGFEVVMDPESARILDGARIDWIETMMESGFKVENPNLAPIGSKPLEGPLADRVRQAIDQYVNPGVAQHGGHVTLVEVRDDIVYLQMGGGCQGCGMASVTLSQGIERILREQVPEIAGIQDVTNHSAGDSPYFAAAK